MTIPTKQRLTLLVLIVLAIWPLAHRGLVARYNMTPWKLMGFAMYCVPRFPPLVEVHAYYGERRSPVDPSGAQMLNLRRELERFKIFRDVWGAALTPDRISEAAASVLTRANEIEVVVTEGYLDRETWRVAVRETVYPYPVTPHAAAPDESSARRRTQEAETRRQLRQLRRVEAQERRVRRRQNDPPP